MHLLSASKLLYKQKAVQASCCRLPMPRCRVCLDSRWPRCPRRDDCASRASKFLECGGAARLNWYRTQVGKKLIISQTTRGVCLFTSSLIVQLVILSIPYSSAYVVLPSLNRQLAHHTTGFSMPPAAIGPTQAQDGQTNSQQVSGAAVFWSLAAIVVNVMTQPSFCGYSWSGNRFEGNLWPHRSSPIICIADAVVEIWIIVDKFCRPPGIGCQEPSATAKPTDIVLRLAVFFLTVVPATIKIFSISGIWVTQVLAASFLLATLVSMIRGLCVEAPQKDIKDFIQQLGARYKSRRAAGIITSLAGLLHLIMLYCMWYYISSVAIIPTSESFAVVALRASFIISTLSLVYLLQDGLFRVAGSISPISRFSIAVGFCALGNLDLSRLSGAGGRTRNQWTVGEALLFNIFLFSYIVAVMLSWLTRNLLKWFSSSVEPAAGVPYKSEDMRVPLALPMQQTRSEALQIATPRR